VHLSGVDGSTFDDRQHFCTYAYDGAGHAAVNTVASRMRHPAAEAAFAVVAVPRFAILICIRLRGARLRAREDVTARQALPKAQSIHW
jgi:hypothetical protein